MSLEVTPFSAIHVLHHIAYDSSLTCAEVDSMLAFNVSEWSDSLLKVGDGGVYQVPSDQYQIWLQPIDPTHQLVQGRFPVERTEVDVAELYDRGPVQPRM